MEKIYIEKKHFTKDLVNKIYNKNINYLLDDINFQDQNIINFISGIYCLDLSKSKQSFAVIDVNEKIYIGKIIIKDNISKIHYIENIIENKKMITFFAEYNAKCHFLENSISDININVLPDKLECKLFYKFDRYDQMNEIFIFENLKDAKNKAMEMYQDKINNIKIMDLFDET